MKIITLTICSALAVVACSAGETPSPDPTSAGGGSHGSSSSSTTTAGSTSGSRIKVRKLTAEDGATMQSGLYDSQLQANCDFVPSADGVLRCLPFGPTQLYWADQGCTQPLVSVPQGCAIPTYARAGADSCPSATHVFTVGAVTTPPNTLYGKPNGACTTVIATPPGFFWYALSGELSAPNFVSATESLE